MNNDDRLLDLYGRTKAVIHKCPDCMVILFEDEQSGVVIVVVPRAHTFYEFFARGERYHLQVSLEGDIYVKKDGNYLHRNNLVLKRAQLV